MFVGIQVSNWNESRLEQERARGYLERIQVDLQDDIGELGRGERERGADRVAGHAAALAQGELALKPPRATVRGP